MMDGAPLGRGGRRRPQLTLGFFPASSFSFITHLARGSFTVAGHGMAAAAARHWQRLAAGRINACACAAAAGRASPPLAADNK